MPRPNKGRTIGREEYLAQRVQTLREDRGYTYEGLAKRMRDMGCQIQASAIFKIEKSEPRRRITVDELYAFARVFDVPVDELMELPGERPVREAETALQAVQRDWQAIRNLQAEIDRAQDSMSMIGQRYELNREYLVQRLAQLDPQVVQTMLSETYAELADELRTLFDDAHSEGGTTNA